MAEQQPVVSKDQFTAIIERALYGVAMFFLAKLVAKGVIDAEMAAYLAGGFVTLAGSAYAWWINRPKALAMAASNAGMTVVAPPEIANTTPNHPTIVSNTEAMVVPKANG